MKVHQDSDMRKATTMIEIAPQWDPTGTVAITVDEQRAEVMVRGGGQVIGYRLRDDRPQRLGWVERRLESGLLRRRRVSVGEVVCGCLREWDAEQAVIALSVTAAQRAAERWPAHRDRARRLAHQARRARGGGRVALLPFQVLWAHHTDSERPEPLSASVAARRIGFELPNGSGDTQRLKRRLGLLEARSAHPRPRQRLANYETGVALCRAIDIEPAQCGL